MIISQEEGMPGKISGKYHTETAGLGHKTRQQQQHTNTCIYMYMYTCTYTVIYSITGVSWGLN